MTSKLTSITDEKIEDVIKMAQESAKIYGGEWDSALIAESPGNNVHGITSDHIEAVVVRTDDDSLHSSWLCDYLESVSPAFVIAALNELQERRKAAMDSEPVAWLLSGGGAKNVVCFDSGNAYSDPLREVTPLYTDPRPAPTSAEPFAYIIQDKYERERGVEGHLSRSHVSKYVSQEDINEHEITCTPLYRHAQPAPVGNEFIPKNLDRALGVLGMALPESKEEFNLQTERWIQRLIDRVIRYADEFKEQTAPQVSEQPSPVVPDERAAFNAWNNEDNLPIAGVGAKNAAWLAWQARAMLQDGNCRENSNSSTNNFREISETSTNRSREHFISLCNEFWNWSEMDEVCAEDRGYERRMEWNGKVFKHPVTQALWRMYQAAPGHSPVIPDGWKLVPVIALPSQWAAGQKAHDNAGINKVDAVYKAMIEAAPPAPTQENI